MPAHQAQSARTQAQRNNKLRRKIKKTQVFHEFLIWANLSQFSILSTHSLIEQIVVVCVFDPSRFYIVSMSFYPQVRFLCQKWAKNMSKYLACFPTKVMKKIDNIFVQNTTIFLVLDKLWILLNNFLIGLFVVLRTDGKSKIYCVTLRNDRVIDSDVFLVKNNNFQPISWKWQIKGPISCLKCVRSSHKMGFLLSCFILTWRGRGSCSPKRVIIKARRLIEYTALHAAVCGRLWLQLRLYVRRRIFARVGLCACRRPRT